jgi:hypothetical protein
MDCAAEGVANATREIPKVPKTHKRMVVPNTANTHRSKGNRSRPSILQSAFTKPFRNYCPEPPQNTKQFSRRFPVSV